MTALLLPKGFAPPCRSDFAQPAINVLWRSQLRVTLVVPGASRLLENGQQFQFLHIALGGCHDYFISLAWFYSLKGDIQKAHEYSNQALVTAKKYNQEYVIIKALDTIAYCFFQEGKYKEALASHQESLQYRIQTDQPSIKFLGYNNLFKYYYERFRMENNRLFLEKAGEQLLKMEDLRGKLSEDSLSMFLIRHDKAFLLKHGSFKEKAQAIEIFKQLLEVESESLYHREVAIHLIDLLFENIVITEDESIIKEIETIMKRLEEYPLLRNPKAVFGYTSQ